MSNIQILASAKYLPENNITNEQLEKQFELPQGYLKKRTGIEVRHYAEDEIEKIAYKAVEKLEKEAVRDVDMIIVATTSTDKIMPGISNYIQKRLKIERCICLDILAGCGGFINALDIAKMYIQCGKVKKALVIGVELLSKIIDKEDLDLLAVLSDGAGAVLVEKSKSKKQYYSNIVSTIDNKNILEYQSHYKINMKGKDVYRYAVTESAKNIKELLHISNEKIENIKYIIPHQSNLKIIEGITSRIGCGQEKMFTNIQETGNTFCASIPIAIAEMMEKKSLKSRR